MDTGERQLSLKLNPTAKGVMLFVFFVMVATYAFQQWEASGRPDLLGALNFAYPRPEVVATDAAPVAEEQPITASSEQAPASGGAVEEQAAPTSAGTGAAALDFEESLAGAFDELKGEIQALEGRLEPGITDLRSDYTDVSAQIADLSDQLAAIEEKVAGLSVLHTASFKVFDPKNSTASPEFPDPVPAWTFASATVDVDLGEGERAVLSSNPEGTGTLVFDNELLINGKSVGPGFRSLRSPGNVPADEAWEGIPPIDVTPHVPQGKSSVLFELKDDGGWHGNGPIFLTVFRR